MTKGARPRLSETQRNRLPGGGLQAKLMNSTAKDLARAQRAVGTDQKVGAKAQADVRKKRADLVAARKSQKELP